MITLLNTSILTGGEGCYSLRRITLDDAIACIEHDGYESAIGHQSTAEILTSLLGCKVNVNRVNYEQRPGAVALVFKLRGRPEEGKILSRREIEEIGYDFFLLKMEHPIELTVQPNQYDSEARVIDRHLISHWVQAVRALLSGRGTALQQQDGSLGDILHINEVRGKHPSRFGSKGAVEPDAAGKYPF